MFASSLRKQFANRTKSTGWGFSFVLHPQRRIARCNCLNSYMLLLIRKCSTNLTNPKCHFTRQYHHFSLSLLDNPIIKNPNQFAQILSHSITSGNFLDPYVSSKLLLISNHSIAPTLFSQIQEPNIYAWNAMSRIYAHGSSPHDSICLYNDMRRKGVSPDDYTYPFVLKACSRVQDCEKGREIHCMSLKFGFEYDVFAQNCLISMYFVCGMIEPARRVFDFLHILNRDVVTWNSMISGYVQSELCEEALEVFRSMCVSKVVRPNDVTFASALTACGRTTDLDLGRKIHGFIVGSGLALDVYIGSSLIAMYAKCGCAEEARRVFDRMQERNVVCWTSMIAGCAQSSLCKEAIELFREMQIEGVKADEATVASVASACAHLGALDQGRWVHAYCERNGIHMNLSVSSALIDMYAKCGDIPKAFEVFHKLDQKDVFSWTVMISGLAMNGYSDEALELFSQMKSSSEVTPNKITFLGVLTACTHGGLVDQGFHHFESMLKTYNLVPHIEHYGCMVDLLGRANLLNQAVSFVGDMPIEPDVVIWRSLLFSSRINGNIELAEFATRKILEFEPKRCGARVLLSNVYAAASRWTDVKRVRKGMVSDGIRKQSGCSFLEINGVAHEFFVGDTSHPETDMINETVRRISHQLRSEGYELGDTYLLNIKL